MEFFSSETFDFFIRLVVAMVLGLAIGTERVFARKTAGMRTYALVAMGSALFVLVPQITLEAFTGSTNYDPLRVASQVVVGLGFIGAGIIIFEGRRIRGLTTAAGIWVAGGIGIAAGYGLYAIAVLATLLTLFTFTILWFVEEGFKKLLVEPYYGGTAGGDEEED